MSAPARAELLAAARAVPDPEIPVLTLGDLGVIRDLRVTDGGAVEIDLTQTYTGCPATEVIAADVQAALTGGLVGRDDLARHVGIVVGAHDLPAPLVVAAVPGFELHWAEPPEN